jgi:hypothetical protein
MLSGSEFNQLRFALREDVPPLRRFSRLDQCSVVSKQKIAFRITHQKCQARAVFMMRQPIAGEGMPTGIDWPLGDSGPLLISIKGSALAIEGLLVSDQ